MGSSLKKLASIRVSVKSNCCDNHDSSKNIQQCVMCQGSGFIVLNEGDDSDEKESKS